MGFFKECNYNVHFVLIPTHDLLKEKIMCGEYKEFLSTNSIIHDEPHIVRGIKWNNTHFLPILSRERHCKLPIIGSGYYEDTEHHKAYEKMADEFHENHYGRVTRYLFGDEPIPNKQSPAHWFNNFKLWVMGWENYERPFGKTKWGNFKE